MLMTLFRFLHVADPLRGSHGSTKAVPIVVHIACVIHHCTLFLSVWTSVFHINRVLVKINALGTTQIRPQGKLSASAKTITDATTRGILHSMKRVLFIYGGV